MRRPYTYQTGPRKGPVLGPRLVPYRAATGERLDASIRVRLGAREVTVFDDGHRLEDVTGRVWAEINGWRFAQTFCGGDDIQALRDCLWLAGAWMIGVARAEGLTLLPDGDWSVTEWAQLYEPAP